MIPYEEQLYVPMTVVKIDEQILEYKVVEERVEKIQESKVTSKHEDRISTLVLETTNKVGTLKTCEEEDMGFSDDEDCKISMDSYGIKDSKVCDFDYGINLNMIITNPMKFSMVILMQLKTW